MSENEELVKRLREQAQNASPADPTIRVEWQAAAALSRSAPSASGPSEEEIIVARKYAAMEPVMWPHTPEPTDLIAHRNVAILLARAVLRMAEKL